MAKDLNKKAFVEVVAEKTGLTKKAAGEYLEVVLATVSETLKDGGKVFGSPSRPFPCRACTWRRRLWRHPLLRGGRKAPRRYPRPSPPWRGVPP